MSENASLNCNQQKTLSELRKIGGWCATYEHHHLNGHTLNALKRKGILESRERPGRPSIIEFRIKTECL